MLPEFDSFGKSLMMIGLLLLIIGALVHFGGKYFPFGKLPGDISIEKEAFHFHFPIVTSLVISVILTIILNLLFRR